MKEVYLHKFDMPRSCVDCDFRQGTNCKAQRIDDGEYVSCHQSKSSMKDGKPITCPLKCIESGELCDREEVRKETAREILQELYNRLELVSEDGLHTMMVCNTHLFDLAKQFNIELEEEV